MEMNAQFIAKFFDVIFCNRKIPTGIDMKTKDEDPIQLQQDEACSSYQDHR
jgi:hypothetical protein